MKSIDINLFESDDAKTSINAIKAIIGNPIQLLYREIRLTAEKYSLNHPDMYNFARIAGAAKSRWLDKFGNQLKIDIRKLVEVLPPKSARILKDALMKRPSNYKEFMLVFIPALVEVGRKINDASLVSLANSWTKAERDYKEYIESLIDDGIDVNVPTSEPKKPNLTGNQNQQAEALINDVINRLPEKYKHQVRTKIAKSENKLLTLQQELSKLGISL